MKPQLDAAEIIRSVESETGLGRFNDDGLRSRVRTLIEKFNDQAALTADNLPAVRAQVAKTLVARLKLARDWAEHPEIADEKIERPLFIVGYGRTGTTVTHSLLAEDPANRPVTWAESMHPSPPPGSDPVGELARTTGAMRDLADCWMDAVPTLLQPHPYFDHGIRTPIECEELFAIDFLNDYPARYFRVPIAPLDTAASDPVAAYRFEKHLLQHLQWKQPTQRWLLKGVFHQFVLDALWAVFPDACCVWTHRNPVQVVPSMFGIYTAIYDVIAPGFDHAEYARRMLTGLRAGMDHVMASPTLDDPRVVHVRFADFMADQVGTIRGIYRKFGFDYTQEFEDRMRHWLASPHNKPDRYGKFRYGFEGYGVTAAEVEAMFADYVRRFDL